MAGTGVRHAEMQRDRGAPADDACAGKFLAGSQLDGEPLQLRRTVGMQGNLGKQRLSQRRLDLDLTKIHGHGLAATQRQRDQHRQFQRTIHCVFPRTILAQLLDLFMALPQWRPRPQTRCHFSYMHANQQ